MTENTPKTEEGIMATNPRPLPAEMGPLTTEPSAGEKLFETRRGRLPRPPLPPAGPPESVSS